MAHGAIETEYKGYRFRSRLEARWAIFFDALDIAWRYETQGYEIDGHRYLPDFFLPDSNLWVEVKGDRDWISREFDRMRVVLGARSPLPGFATGETALLLLGDPPQSHNGCTLHPVLTRTESGLTRTWGVAYKTTSSGFKFGVIRPGLLLNLFLIPAVSDLEESPESTGWRLDHQTLPTPGNWPVVRDAYDAARRARFEHGAHGR